MRSFDQKKPTMSAFAKACWLLGRREYAQQELVLALVRREYTKEEAQLAVEKLAEQGWQSDARTASSVVRQSVARHYGPARAKANALHKGLADALWTQAQEEANVDWEKLAQEAAERKYGAAPYSRDLQIKVAGFLLRRGFDGDVAWRVARNTDFDV